MTPYDSGYRLLFSHQVMIRDLLLGYVQQDWVAELDFSTLEKVASSFVTDDLRDREDDVIWRVRWGKQWLFIYILLEFQSRVDWTMAVRINTYVMLLYQDLIRTGQIGEGDALPPVLPLVLYNAKPVWTAARDVSEMISPAPMGLDDFRPRMRYLLIDIVRMQTSQHSPERNLATALFQLEKSRTLSEIRTVIDHLVHWLDDDEQQSLRRAFVVWLKRVLLKKRYPKVKTDSVNDLQEMDAMLAETIDEWTSEWKAAGVLEGKQQGKIEQMMFVLSVLLQEKFGSLPEEGKSRLAQASLEQLENWFKHLSRYKEWQEFMEDGLPNKFE